MDDTRWARRFAGRLCFALLVTFLFESTVRAEESFQTIEFRWENGAPESEGMSSARLEALTKSLASRGTKAVLVIRNDEIVHEWYAKGHGRSKKHYTASMAKALVGGVSLAIAINDGLISLDDKAATAARAGGPTRTEILVRRRKTPSAVRVPDIRSFSSCPV